MSAEANPPILIVATEQDLHELVAQSLMSTFLRQMLPWNSVLYPWQQSKRLFGYVIGHALNRSPNETRLHTREEAFLEQIRLLTGFNFRIARFSPDEAAQRFAFQGGIRPSSGQVYFQHPFRPCRYIAPATMNLMLARERVFAFHDIAASLGAKTIRLLSGDVKSKTWFGKAAVPLPDAAAQVGINAAFEEGSLVRTQIYSEFDKPESLPSVPEDLELWVKSDPSFESLERGRLNNRASLLRATLELTEFAEYSAKVVGVYDNVGLDVGGGYRDLIQSIWHFSIEFWPN